MTKRSFTREQDREVARLYGEGLSTRAIAQRYGVDKSTVSEALAREGVARRDNRGVTDEQESQLVQLYQAGLTMTEIAEQAGLSFLVVKAALDRQGIKKPDGRYTFTSEQEKDIVKAYLAGQTALSIAQRYKTKSKTVKATLTKDGISIRRGDISGKEAKGKSKIFSNEQEQEIIELYQGGLAPKTIAGDCKVSRKAVLNVLDRHEIERRSQRVNFFNEQAFDNLDSELPLYWIGFLYADGYASAAELKLGLAIRDIGHVEKFRDFMKGENPIQARANACHIGFASIYLVKRARELGIVVKRNCFHLLEPLIPEGLEHHFIRGVLDGDGCLSSNGQVAFAGQFDSLTWISSILHAKVGVNLNPIRYKQGICESSWGGRLQTRRIIDYLYQDATVWLDRKKKIAENWK